MMNKDVDSLLRLAAVGDARAALRAAAHLKFHGAGASDYDYVRLLDAVLVSNDADSIAWGAEALQLGDALFKDPELSARFLKRADELSGFMGTFLMGKMLLRADRQLAYKVLSRSAKMGHIPSRTLMCQIWCERHHILGLILKPVFVLTETMRISRALKMPNAHLLFWRYKDAFKEPAQVLNDRFSKEAESPFGSFDYTQVSI